MKFKFEQDRKCTIWERFTFEVEADSLQEARAKVLEQAYTDYNLDDHFPGYYDLQHDTLEQMEPEENGGQSTRDILFEGESIWENASI